MYWIQEMLLAIAFMEDRLTEEIRIEDIARSAHSSAANFQRIFRVVTGITAGDYIRLRRLTLAGREIAEEGADILDTALKYRYESAGSFTKAFSRFHGVTPAAARRDPSTLKRFDPLSIRVEIRGGFAMRRKLIPNIPVIPYDGNNAAFFITLLEAVLRGLGEDCDRAKLIALSGEGNRFCWTDGAWVFGNEMPDAVNEEPFDTQRRVLEAIGWKAKYITVQRGSDKSYLNTGPEEIRRDFVKAIDRGHPVIVRYIRHDDCDMNVFFGYEDGGRKIIGYAYNQGFEPGISEPDGAETPVAWENWEDNIAEYILLKERTESATERGAALAAFARIRRHARFEGEIRGRKIGLAAWESFLVHLERDDFSGLSAEEVMHRFFIYCDALGQIDARNGALPYYRRLAQCFPKWRAPLEAAVNALAACASYGGFLWSAGFTFDEAGFEKFRSPQARKQLAEAGREAMRQDLVAVGQFEKILRIKS